MWGEVIAKKPTRERSRTGRKKKNRELEGAKGRDTTVSRLTQGNIKRNREREYGNNARSDVGAGKKGRRIRRRCLFTERHNQHGCPMKGEATLVRTKFGTCSNGTHNPKKGEEPAPM